MIKGYLALSRLKVLNEHLQNLLEINAGEDIVNNVREKIKRSKRGKSSKVKGATYESSVSKILKEAYPILDLARVPASGGFQKKSNNELLRGDIVNLNDKVDFKLHIECKNCKTLKLKDWWKQCESDCLDKIPIVIMHQGQEIKEGKRVSKADDFVYLRLSDFIDIVDKKKIMEEKN